MALLFAIGALVFHAASARAANIVWVTDNGPAGFSALGGTVFAEDGWFTLLTNAGHSVIKFNPPDAQGTLLTGADMTALNTNDLIIIGRSVASGAFQGSQQVAQWNTNITKPILSINVYLTRNTRMCWFVGANLPNGTPTTLTALNLADPKTAYIFGGVAMNGSTTASVYDEAGGQNTSQITDLPVSGGVRLATGGSWNVISEWPANTMVRTNLDRLGGYRMQFSAGLREPSGGTVPQAGTENLTATGENIFLRAVIIAVNGGNLPNPPSAPTNLAGISLSGQVQLNWSSASLASGYYIKRAEVSGGPYTNIGTNGLTTSYADFTVVNDTTYYYVVSAFNSVGESANSTEITVTPRNAPANVVAVGGTNQITVSWDALPGADTYTVKRSTSSTGPFTTITNGLTGTSHVDALLGNGLTYYYVVVAQLTGGGGDSGQSSTVSATTAPGASTLTTVRFAATALQLSWTSGGSVVSQYLIETSPDGVNFSPLTAVASTPLNYIHGGLALDTVYSYRIQATNAGGLSPYSNITTNRTPTGGYNINIANSGNSSQSPLPAPAPVPPGYLVDEGEVFGDRTNGFFYGWTTLGGTNITRDSRRRESALSADVRYDTLNQFMKNNVNTPATTAIWEFELPNGFYSVHAVGGDAGAIDSVFQFNIEGVNTAFLSATNVGRWAEFTVDVGVSDGRLTIKAGPQAVNHKFCFVDIYPAVPVPPVISVHPQTQTVEENRLAELSVTLSQGSPTLVYQWYFNDAPLLDATNRTLVFPHVPTSAQGDYYLIVTNYGGSATSTVATLTVPEDTTAASIVSIGSLDGLQIGVCFDEELNPTGAVELGNYAVNEGAANITNIILRPDGRSVVLQIDAPITGPFTVQVFSLADLADNLADGVGTNNTVLGLSTGDIGNPLRLGSHYTCDNENIEIVGGGTDIWNAADQFHYAYRSFTGDFDARVRVTSLLGSNAITKAAIVARDSTNAGSPVVHVSVNPLAPGRDLAQMAARTVENAISATVGTNIAPGGIPNAWLRLQRAGFLFTGYHSTNGSNWTIMGQTNVPLNSPLLLGLGLTAHDTNLLATGIFSNFRVTSTAPPALSGATYSNGTFSASFNTIEGVNYQVQYRTNLPPGCGPGINPECPGDTDTWTPLLTIPGDGTVKTFTDPTVPLPDRRFYRIATVP